MNDEYTINKIIKKELPKLAQAYFDVVLCQGDATTYSETNVSRITRAFENLLPKVSIDFVSTEELNAPEDVLKAMANGGVTLTDATKLLENFHKKTEMQDTKELLEKMEEILKQAR